MLFQNYKSINKKVDKAFIVHSMNSFLNVGKNNSDFLVVSEKKRWKTKGRVVQKFQNMCPKCVLI